MTSVYHAIMIWFRL